MLVNLSAVHSPCWGWPVVCLHSNRDESYRLRKATELVSFDSNDTLAACWPEDVERETASRHPKAFSTLVCSVPYKPHLLTILPLVLLLFLALLKRSFRDNVLFF